MSKPDERESRNFLYPPERDLRHNVGIPPSPKLRISVCSARFMPSEEEE
jgi:hypothetical protein